jgi:APA family basic amino acid/polyamine antiporter
MSIEPATPPGTVAAPAAPASAPTLARRLGLFDMTMLVMGSVIGVGIFKVPRDVARELPFPVLALAAWVLGGIVTLAGSLVYAELTRRRPLVGGQYAFLRESYHPAVAFVYGWSLLWIIQSGGMASVAVVFADYFLQLAGDLGTWLGPDSPFGFLANWPQKAGAPALVTTIAIGGLTLINCTGVRSGGTTQNIFMILKIAAILMLVACGLAYAGGSAGAVEGAAAASAEMSVSAVHPPSGPGVLMALAVAMVPIFFAYGGWHTTTFVCGEVRDPRRTLSRALVLGVCGVMALYLGVNYACLRVLGVDRLAMSAAPASEVARLALGTPGAVAISVGIAISALGFLSQATLTSPRVYYAMAEDGLFFRAVAWIHPRTRVPVVAIALQGLFAIVIALTGTFNQILNYVMSVEMVFWILTSLGLFIIRRQDAGLPDSAKLSMPGHPLTTLVFVAVNFAVLVNLFFENPINSAIGIGIALAGVPVYFAWRGRQPTKALLAAAEPQPK